MGINANQLFFTECYEGSVVLKGYSTPAAIASYTTMVNQGGNTLPVMNFDRTGNTAPADPNSTDVSIGIIIGAAIGGVILLAIVIFGWKRLQ